MKKIKQSPLLAFIALVLAITSQVQLRQIGNELAVTEKNASTLRTHIQGRFEPSARVYGYDYDKAAQAVDGFPEYAYDWPGADLGVVVRYAVGGRIANQPGEEVVGSPIGTVRIVGDIEDDIDMMSLGPLPGPFSKTKALVAIRDQYKISDTDLETVQAGSKKAFRYTISGPDQKGCYQEWYILPARDKSLMTSWKLYPCPNNLLGNYKEGILASVKFF